MPAIQTRRWIIMGPPGAGKGTQAEMLSNRFRIPHISSGQCLRELTKHINKKNTGDPTSDDAKLLEKLNSGDLVGDDFVVKVVLNNIGNMKSYLLDGIPRNIQQAEALENIVDKAIYIELSPIECINRICNRNEAREDDTEEIAAHRIEVYHKETDPLIKYFATRDALIVVDGSASKEKVFQDILKRIN